MTIQIFPVRIAEAERQLVVGGSAFKAFNNRKAMSPCPHSIDYRFGLFYFTNQTQGGRPAEAVLYQPQPEKGPPIWGWICIKGLIVALWKQIGGNLADFIHNISIDPNLKINNGDC